MRDIKSFSDEQIKVVREVRHRLLGLADDEGLDSTLNEVFGGARDMGGNATLPPAEAPAPEAEMPKEEKPVVRDLVAIIADLDAIIANTEAKKEVIKAAEEMKVELEKLKMAQENAQKFLDENKALVVVAAAPAPEM